MSVLDEKREELEHYEFRMGVPRGRLAVALDTLTDALTMVGQHGVYCQSARQPGKPAMDIQIVMKSITDAKELIASVMEEIRKQKEDGRFTTEALRHRSTECKFRVVPSLLLDNRQPLAQGTSQHFELPVAPERQTPSASQPGNSMVLTTAS